MQCFWFMMSFYPQFIYWHTLCKQRYKDNFILAGTINLVSGLQDNGTCMFIINNCLILFVHVLISMKFHLQPIYHYVKHQEVATF